MSLRFQKSFQSIALGLLVVLAVGFSILVRNVTAEPCVPDALQATLNNDAFSFGNAVAISGNLAVVGSNLSDPAKSLACVFNATTGAPIITLESPSPDNSDYFGFSVAISGNLILVGARDDDSSGVLDAGTAYVFNATTGALVATLNNPAPLAGSGAFGYSVALSGIVAVVGAPYYDESGTGGIVHVFNAATGALIATLNNPAPSFDEQFGTSVAISGNIAVVGAIHDEGNGVIHGGAAHVFNATTGALVTTLYNPTPSGSDFFGESVAISGTKAVVGAYSDYNPFGNGAAYIFDAMTGTLLSTLYNPAYFMLGGGGFGDSVACSGNLVLVGAPGQSLPGNPNIRGAAYFFDALTGDPIATLNNPAMLPGSSSHEFGYAVALTENKALIGVAGHGEAIAYTYSCPLPTPTPTPSPTPFNNALALGNTIPPIMAPSQSLGVGVTFRNTGNMPWYEGSGHALAVMDGACLITQGTRVYVRAGDVVMPNQQYQFITQITAPATLGLCDIDFRMVEEFVEFFGETIEATTSVEIPPNVGRDWATYE